MEIIGKNVIMAGILVAFLAQIIGSLLVFRFSFLRGILSLIIPGYMLLALKQSGHYMKLVSFWFIGLIGMIVGMVLVS